MFVYEKISLDDMEELTVWNMNCLYQD